MGISENKALGPAPFRCLFETLAPWPAAPASTSFSVRHRIGARDVTSRERGAVSGSYLRRSRDGSRPIKPFSRLLLLCGPFCFFTVPPRFGLGRRRPVSGAGYQGACPRHGRTDSQEHKRSGINDAHCRCRCGLCGACERGLLCRFRTRGHVCRPGGRKDRRAQQGRDPDLRAGSRGSCCRERICGPAAFTTDLARR